MRTTSERGVAWRAPISHRARAVTAAHPFRAGQRIYFTGDRGRWTEDGKEREDRASFHREHFRESFGE